jgi:nitroreductase
MIKIITIKRFLKSVIIKFNAFKIYSYDSNRYLKHSNSLRIKDTEEKLIGQIITKYHVIEKGLTMPKMKYGFGKEMILSLIDDCFIYKRKHNDDNPQWKHAIEVISEYNQVHKNNKQSLDDTVQEKIELLLSSVPNCNSSKQILCNKDDYFKHVNSSFDLFSASRHSVRNFNGEVPLKTIEKAVALAQNTPSSCNRQPTKVYILNDKVKIDQVLKLQNGNRGFGHLTDKLLIITAENSIYGGIRERNLPYIDAGIYTMNLLYALHFYKIGACTLNWCDTPEIDKQIRAIIDFSPSETIVLLIACGSIPENFKLTTSVRNGTEHVVSII